MLLVPDLGEVAGDLEQHALVRRNLTRTFLSDAFVEISDRRTQRAGDFEQPSGRDTIYPALVFVRLLISDANHLGQLLLGQAQHNAALTNSRSDMIIDRGSRPPSLRLCHAAHPALCAQNALVPAFMAINAITV